MAETPRFDDVLQQAQQGFNNEDVRFFLDYTEDLKRLASRWLTGRARVMPGVSAVAASALASMLRDLAGGPIPLNDVDNQGRPALWPLLLKYVERHCKKWNAWYQAKKRKGVEVSLHAGVTIDPEDYRAPADDEKRFAEVLEELDKKLSEEERQVVEARLAGKTPAEIAEIIGKSESTVYNILARIRKVLQTL
jgi:RNA polymerase sigma factor (sigma-70 family)